MKRYFQRSKNFDRRNPAGGLATGVRTVKKGGWLVFGGDIFYSARLEKFAGWRFWVRSISDAFSPETADGYLESLPANDVVLDNVYHLARKNELPEHLEFLRKRLGKIT